MKSLFREQVLKNQNQRMQGEVSLVQVPTFTWLTGLIAFIVVCSIAFLVTNSYTRKAVVFGVLQPEQGVIRVQTAQPGTVQQLLVEEGGKVEAGQALLQLNMDRYSGGRTEFTAALRQEMTAILANLQQQKQQEQERYEIRQRDIVQRIGSAEQQAEQLREQQKTFAERLELNQHLVAQISQLSGSGFISNQDLIRQRDTWLSLQQQEQILNGQQLSLQEQLKQQQSLLQQLPLEHQASQARLDNQISELRNQLTRLQHEQSSTIKAPVAGTVSGILPRAGHFMEAGDVALSLIPAGAELEVVLYVPTRSIAFIDEGQAVRLRFHAFPYERFGVHHGSVKEVSNTVLLPNEVLEVALQEPSYRVRVQLTSQHILAYNRELPLRAGMTLDADVITERRSLLRWLFDPIFSIRGQL